MKEKAFMHTFERHIYRNVISQFEEKAIQFRKMGEIGSFAVRIALLDKRSNVAFWGASLHTFEDL
jgi:hypothetical protein